MELTKLYVLVVKGEKHYYASDIDRNYGYNVLTHGLIPAEKYEIELEK